LHLGCEVFSLVVDLYIPLYELRLKEFDHLHRHYQGDGYKVSTLFKTIKNDLREEKHPGTETDHTLLNDRLSEVTGLCYFGLS
jgi:hypothetical protein